MTILVTGATGFIGRRLARPGDRRMVRNPAGLSDEARGDLLDSASLEKACQGVNTVFHCAGYAHTISSADPVCQWTVNYRGTKNLLEAAGRAGVQRFVFLSSVNAMAKPGDACVDENHPGAPVSLYGKVKRAAENAVLDAGVKYGMHVVILRLPLVYGKGVLGNMAQMVRGIRAGWLPPLPETKNRRSLIHVSDVVSAIRRVSEDARANGKTYIVADPHPYSGRELYDALRKTLGMPPACWRISARLFRLSGRLGDLLLTVSGRAPPAPLEGLISRLLDSTDYAPERIEQELAGGPLGDLLIAASGKTAPRRTLPRPSELVSRFLDSACYSPARIQKELGWSARVGLMEGLREMLSP